jgi:hypothetical protein
MVDETHKMNQLKGVSGKAAKQKIKAAKAAKMPYLQNKGLADDIREGVIAREAERREHGQSIGMNLPSAAPTDPNWREDQSSYTADEKTRRKELKAQRQLPGQIAKDGKKARKAKKTGAEGMKPPAI